MSHTTPPDMVTLLAEAKRLAIDYYALTGRPLGITGEVAEYEATRLLGLQLAEVRAPGYDAVEQTPDGLKRIQIKGRRIGPRGAWGRMGSVNLTQDFDTVMLVLLDESYETTSIWEAPRGVVEAHLSAPGSKARNERGAMAASAFVRLATRRWPA